MTRCGPRPVRVATLLQEVEAPARKCDLAILASLVCTEVPPQRRIADRVSGVCSASSTPCSHQTGFCPLSSSAAQAQRCRAPAGRRARRVSSARRGRHGQQSRRERGPRRGARACVVHPGALAEAQRGRPGSCGGDAIAALAGLSTLHVSGASHHSVSSLPCIAPTRPHPLWCPPRRAPRAPLPVLGPFRAAPLPRRALC